MSVSVNANKPAYNYSRSTKRIKIFFSILTAKLEHVSSNVLNRKIFQFYKSWKESFSRKLIHFSSIVELQLNRRCRFNLSVRRCRCRRSCVGRRWNRFPSFACKMLTEVLSVNVLVHDRGTKLTLQNNGSALTCVWHETSEVSHICFKIINMPSL